LFKNLDFFQPWSNLDFFQPWSNLDIFTFTQLNVTVTTAAAD